MVALLIFIMAAGFEFVAEKKLFDGGGPFSSDVFKIRLDINKHF